MKPAKTLQRIAEERPQVPMDKIISQRFPRFELALHELDDAISTAVLFSSVERFGEIDEKVIRKLEKHLLEFKLWVIKSRSLRKTFLSTKGIFYRATVQGVDVTWLEPYKLRQFEVCVILSACKRAKCGSNIDHEWDL